MSKFIKEAEARLHSDDPKESIKKAHKRTQSIFKSAIGSLEIQLDKDGDAVEKAQEILGDTIYVVNAPNDEDAYLKAILDAKNNLEQAKENEAQTKATIEFLKELQADK